jgi:hypothetical protein
MSLLHLLTFKRKPISEKKIPRQTVSRLERDTENFPLYEAQNFTSMNNFTNSVIFVV